jgi:hypothetical protein
MLKLEPVFALAIKYTILYHPLVACNLRLYLSECTAFLDPGDSFLVKNCLRSGAGEAQGSAWIDVTFGRVCQALIIFSFDALDT